ncbi:MAG: WecB/TagA/CpsF family glycosyltransferase [Patescibacteria group bacterium]
MIKEYHILGIKIQSIPEHLIKELLRSFLNSDQQNQIVTVNPEFVVAAQKNKKFASVINEASLATIDGTGLVQALQILGYKVSLDDRLTGVKLMEKLLEIAQHDQLKVLFCLYHHGLTSHHALAAKLKDKYPKLNFYLADENNCLTITDVKQPDIIFSTLGAPRQDVWLAENIHKMPSVKIAVGVGGAVDFLSGAIRRAPKIFRSLGLEWLWRLFRQPRRLPRIWRAIIIFYALVLKYKWQNKNYAQSKN